jgi:hypothetical protein
MSGSWIGGQNSFHPCEDDAYKMSCRRVGPAAVVAGGCWNVPVLFCGCLQPEDVRGIIA